MLKAIGAIILIGAMAVSAFAGIMGNWFVCAGCALMAPIGVVLMKVRLNDEA